VCSSDLQLLEYAHSKPGRLSYPKPPEFHGTTFLKLLLVELNSHHSALYEAPVADQQELLLATLWDYLDQLHPLLWRAGREFPVSAAQQQQLLAHGVLDNAVSFNPGELASAQRARRLPSSIVPALIGSRAITNSHYLAIPKRAANVDGALKVINFFLSEAAQQRKQAADGWGDTAVIRWSNDDHGVSLFPAQPEPHVGWVKLIEQQWLARYQQ
jgi:putative thiamine transport system substrate-binding protein